MLRILSEHVSSNSILKEKISKWRKKFQFTPSNIDPFFLEIADSKIIVKKGVCNQPTATLLSSHQDLIDVISGKADGLSYFFTGKLRINGNVMDAQQLNDLLKEYSTIRG